MAQEFHFQHHRLEAKRNRSRMAMALVSIIAATAGIAYQQYFTVAAITTVQLNDATTGTSLGQFEYSGSWSTDTPVGAFHTDNHFSNGATAYYQVRFNGNGIKIYGEKNADLAKIAISIDGGTETVVDPYNSSRLEQQLLYTSPTLASANHIMKVRNTATKNASSGGIYMSADRVDVTSGTASTPTPTIAPATPKPTVKPVATPAPVPAGQTAATPRPTAKPAAAPASNSQATPAPVVQDTVPTVPGNVSALVTGDNAIVTLHWSASTSGTGISAYRVDRMSDGADWATLNVNITELEYVDRTAAFAVHYRYRLSAISGTGKASDYAIVDATTGNFVATSVTTTTGSFKSDDKLATAEVPAGALGTNANCSILTVPASVATSSLKVVAGSYSLICKDARGKVLDEFAQPIKWSVNLKGKLGGVSSPDAAVIDNTSGAAVSIPGAIYDPKSQTIHFNQTSSSTVAVLGEVKHGTAWIWITFMILLLLGGGVFVYLLRHHQIEKYRDYLLAKYYNL